MSRSPAFILTNKKKGTALVQMFFQFKRRRVVVSTGMKLPVKYWNSEKSRAKQSVDFPQGAEINARINMFQTKTEALYMEYMAKGVIPTAEEFKAVLKARLDDVHVEAAKLIPFIEEVIQERGRLNKSKGSLQIYRNLLHHVEAYQVKRHKKLDFAGLDDRFNADFTAHLFAAGYADAYVHKVVSTLKMFVRLADKRGIYKGSPFLTVDKLVEKRSKDSVYLTEREQRILFDLELDERLGRVRDLLLLGCLTGLRFSDFSKINPANIQPIEHGEKAAVCLVITTQKTDQRIILPIVNPMLKAILERNGNRAPRPMSSQKLNVYIKELCELAGFDQDIEIVKYVSGEQVKVKEKKFNLISSHTGRRSFATNAYKKRVPVRDIMKFTGHTTEASFMKYIRTTTEESAVILSEHEFFTGKTTLKKVE